MYKPVKKPVTLRLDADVLAWFQRGGREKEGAGVRRAEGGGARKRRNGGSGASFLVTCSQEK